MILTTEEEKSLAMESGKAMLVACQLADAYTKKISANLPDPSVLNYVPMKLVKRKVGDVSIEKKYMAEADAVTLRMWLMTGLRPTKVNFGGQKVGFNFLKKDGSTLTSDTPQEMFGQYCEFHDVTGNVLVGGLGLGMAASMIADLPAVKSVTVLEQDKNVIDLIKPQLRAYRKQLTIIHGDLYEYLAAIDCRSTRGSFDSAYFDIWYSTGERDWVSHVVPLYRLCRKAKIAKMRSWGEMEMKKQIFQSVIMQAAHPYGSKWTPYAVFREAIAKLGLPVPLDLTNEESKKAINALAELYVEKVGTPKWEKTFAWREEEKTDESED